MHALVLPLAGLILLAVQSSTLGADFLDSLKRGALGNAPTSALSEEEVTKGLKEALAKGVERAVTNLSKAGGFLNHPDVKIPMPERLARIERGLRAVKQDKLADDFVGTMNHAAELAVPEAAAIFGEAIRAMTLQDAKSLLRGPDDAATQYFRKTSTARLEEKMLPIVKQTTETAGVTASYKKLLEKAGPTTSFLNLDPKGIDLDKYVTGKAVEGLFKRIADEEKAIRQNPAARTTQLLKKVFERPAP